MLHPLWLGSLATLALNDHLLKGSGHLPGWVTGKLSDFAGLLVAPLLLAGLLQLKRKRGWALAHVAVGAVFAAIQLSTAASGAWSGAMGALGITWVTTMDPTDLIALPMLLVSWHWLGQAQVRRAGSNARRSAEAGAAAVGLFACVATSSEPEPFPEDPEPPPGESGDDFGEDDDFGDDEDEREPEYPDIRAGAYVHNGTTRDLVVRIRALRDGVDLDCEAIAEAPGELMTEALFDVAESWTLPSGTNQSLEQIARDFPCQATLVEVDGLSPRLVFWAPQKLPPHTVPGWGATPTDPGELAIIEDARNRFAWRGAEDISFDLTPTPAECALQSDSTRVAWSSPVPVGDHVVTALEYGFDGCFEFTLTGADETVDTWFLCVPESTMTIAAGDEVQISSTAADRGVSVLTFDGDGEFRQVRAESWIDTPQVDGLEVSVVPDFDCGHEVQASCGTVASPVHVSVDSNLYGAAQLLPDGEVTRLVGEWGEMNLALMHGQERAAVDRHCAQGPGLTGFDIELVVSTGPITAE